MEELQNLLAHLKNQGLTDAKIPIDVWCGIIEYFANKQEAKQCNIADVVRSAFIIQDKNTFVVYGLFDSEEKAIKYANNSENLNVSKVSID